MNDWEKEVEESLLDSEEEALKELERQYKSALRNVKDKIKIFQADIDMLDMALEVDPANKDLYLSMRRSKVYQQQFQQALQGQISGILDQMHAQNYATIDKYLKECYEDAYVGTMYDLINQGVPIMTPIDQASMVHAVLTDSKIVRGYYYRLGVDADKLKNTIYREVSRGIASSLPYSEIARNIDNASRSGLYNAQRIARTEGHRIQNTAARDAANDAADHGADLVKIWDATLDGLTRTSHRMVDGEIRELNELFSNGLDRPGDPSGSAEEVINCRCKVKQKPRWALNSGFYKMDNFTGEMRYFASWEDYAQFKEWYWSDANQQYMAYVQQLERKYGTTDFPTVLGSMSEREYQHFHQLESASPMWKAGEHEQQWGIPYGEKAVDVDLDYIHSDEYSSKFELLTDDPQVNSALCDVSTTILEHRIGTMYEDLYLINANDGTIISSITNSKTLSGVHYTEEFTNSLLQARNNNIPIIAIHNHPVGTPPSSSDFIKAFENNYADALVVGHNGIIYHYSNSAGNVTMEEWHTIDNDIQTMVYGGSEIDRAYKRAYNEHGITYEVIGGY